MYPSGGTSIGDGLNIALKILTERKYRNKVSSILLLSDGVDDFGRNYIEKILKKQKDTAPFSIHTFGFGPDHDSQLMT